MLGSWKGGYMSVVFSKLFQEGKSSPACDTLMRGRFSCWRSSSQSASSSEGRGEAEQMVGRFLTTVSSGIIHYAHKKFGTESWMESEEQRRRINWRHSRKRSRRRRNSWGRVMESGFEHERRADDATREAANELKWDIGLSPLHMMNSTRKEHLRLIP